jgi:transcriptional regulator with XRE-family HTH domain
LEPTVRPSGGPSLVKLVPVKEPAASLGEIIRRQRELSRLSMRQFAGLAGISNPYLSQIERGLREPSERVVDAIARSLETSAEALYEQAGFVDDEDEVSAVPTAIEADPALTPRQRRALLDVYEAFVAAGPAPRPRKRRPPRADGPAVESGSST